MRSFKSFLRNESGATAIEYGLIASLVAVGIVTILQSVSWNLNNAFTKVNNALASK